MNFVVLPNKIAINLDNLSIVHPIHVEPIRGNTVMYQLYLTLKTSNERVLVIESRLQQVVEVSRDALLACLSGDQKLRY